MILFSCDYKKNETSSLQNNIECAFLIDDSTNLLVKNIFNEAKIDKGQQDKFFKHTSQFEKVIENVLYKGFKKISLEKIPIYDPYSLQEKWESLYPDFVGYNCRITSFCLINEFLEINPSSEKRNDILMIDMLSLEQDSSAIPSTNDKNKFQVLFSKIPTIESTNINDHLNIIKKDWKNRGISFLENEVASLITVFFHDVFDENNHELMIGHTGILFEINNNELYFIEKIAFQEPYQITKFKNRYELSNYLMWKYDYYVENQKTARPFILENDNLIESYH